MADLTAEPIPRLVDPVTQRDYEAGKGHSKKQRRPRQAEQTEKEDLLLVDDGGEQPHRLDIKA